MKRHLHRELAGAVAAVLCVGIEAPLAADFLTDEKPGTQVEVAAAASGTKAGPERKAILSTPEGWRPFWRDTRVDLQLRTYYLKKNRDAAGDSAAWALGGWLAYRSGLWRNRIQLGGTLFTSQKLYGPDDKSGTGLLKPIQQGFTVLGEAFVDARVTEQAHLRLYRQTFDLPYVNQRDNRMVPNTFEGYLLFDRDDPKFNYVLGHVTRIKERASDKFVHMSEQAGAPGTDKGVSMAGVRYSFTPKIELAATNHYGWDTFNTFYTEAKGAWDVTDGLAFRLLGQYTDQQSTGDEFVGAFDTSHFGVKTAFSTGGGTLSFAYTETGNGGNVRTPWGSFPGYASLIVQDFNRADETVWLAGIAYDFAKLGWDGLSGFINFADGNTPDSGPNASPDQEELDITLDFRFPEGLLKGLWLRARAAFVDQHGVGAQDLSDYRLIVNYSVPIL